MKRVILSIFSLLLVAAMAQAQDGKKAFGKAKKAFGIYNLDPQNNKGKLQEAIDELSIAEADSELMGEAKTWQLKGDVYNEVATQFVAARQLSLPAEELPKVEMAANSAYKAYVKALDLSEKKYESKDALRGIRSAQSNLYNLGIFNYEDGKYAEAYGSFVEIIEAHKVLKKNDTESSLDAEEDYNQQLYITGLAALNAEKASDAASLFEELYNKNYDKPAIYEALYKINAEDDIEKAYAYLDKGRQNYPDDVSLLFAEINHFLKINKLDELIGKIKVAIEKEPDNVSLYSTLGNVYDNLFQKELEAGNEEKAQEHFDNALQYYNDALSKKPDFFDAIYSVGALYYNKAAAKTQELNELSSDFSKEGLKKYEEKKTEIFALFEEALPHFKKAESMDPNDVNTLIALKEIFARKDDLATSNELKARLEKVQSGASNDSSYFNE